MAEIKILLVEDESIVAMDMERRLRSLGYEVVDHVMTGEDAVEKSVSLNPDLILMDIHLKGEVDGIEAADRIKQKTAIPVIYITAYSDEITLDRAKVTEPFGYILKPFQEREIHSTIEMALYKYKIEQQLRRAKEEAESGNRSKSLFLANVSHELRTPLNSILGMTQLAMDCDDGEERREYLEIVKESGESLLALIDSILDFSRVESGRLKLTPGEFFLDEIVETALERLWPNFLEKGLQLYLDLDEGSRFHLFGDGNKLRQVFDNLVQNAVKFTDQGSVAVHVWTETSSEGTIAIFGSVEDTGCGIASEDQELIFSAFQQADTSSTRVYNGAGLGLSIVKELVDLMNGRIEVESDTGKGTRFRFCFQCGLPPSGHDENLPECLKNIPKKAFEKSAVFLITPDSVVRVLRHKQFSGLGIPATVFDENTPEEACIREITGNSIFLIEGDTDFNDGVSRFLMDEGIPGERILRIYWDQLRAPKNSTPGAVLVYPLKRRRMCRAIVSILEDETSRSLPKNINLIPLKNILLQHSLNRQAGAKGLARETMDEFLRDFVGTDLADRLTALERRAQALRREGASNLSEEADKQLLRLILAARKGDMVKVEESLRVLSELGRP